MTLRRHAVWLVTLPIVLAGVEGAHALGNLLAGAPRGELFSSPASRHALPAVAAVLVAVSVSALAARAGGVWSETRRRALLAPFVLLPPVAFTLLEAGEALAHAGAAGSPLDRTFCTGLALQLPVAAVGYLVARALLRLSDGIRALVARRPFRPLAAPALRRPRPPDTVPRTRVLIEALRGRAPPAAAVLPG